jgi:tetratricopeptide (TPR) repeat protein
MRKRSGKTPSARTGIAGWPTSRIALQLAPNEADTNYDLGVAFAKRSEWDAAIAQFRRAIQCDAQCAPAWSDLARTLWDHTDDPTIQAEAYTNARHALELQSTLADPHYVLGCVAQLSGNKPGAIEEFRKAVELEEKDYHSHFNLGICLLQTGQAEYAAGEFSKVLKHDNKNASAWAMLGQACLRLGRLNDAQADFQRALRLNPNLAEAIEGLKKTQSR